MCTQYMQFRRSFSTIELYFRNSNTDRHSLVMPRQTDILRNAVPINAIGYNLFATIDNCKQQFANNIGGNGTRATKNKKG